MDFFRSREDEEDKELLPNPSSQLSTVKEFSKEKIFLNGITFNRAEKDRYKCGTCGEIMNFVLLPAHTRSHRNTQKHKGNSNESRPNLPIPKYTEILEFENPNEEISYKNSKNINKTKKTPAKKQTKNAIPPPPPPDMSEDEEEYVSNHSSGALSESASDNLPNPPSSDSSTKEEKQEDIEEKNTENFRINFDSSNEDSLTSSSGDSTMNHHTIESLQREKGVRGYKCDCDAEFYTYKKYKIHTNIKRASCPRCGEILFCRYLMKNHHIECLKKHFKFRRNEKDKIPNPRYLRGIEESIRKGHALYEPNYKPEDEEWERFADLVMPSKPKRKD